MEQRVWEIELVWVKTDKKELLIDDNYENFNARF